MLPGGGIERGEAPSACVLRELWEEAGATPAGVASGAPLCLALSASPLQCKRSVTFPFMSLMGKLEDVYPETWRKRRWCPLAEVQASVEGSAVAAAVWGKALEVLGGCTEPAAIRRYLQSQAEAAAAAAPGDGSLCSLA